jgi:hypothetical protein
MLIFHKKPYNKIGIKINTELKVHQHVQYSD